MVGGIVVAFGRGTEIDILQSEGGAAAEIGVGRKGVFTGPTEEVESNDAEVEQGLSEGLVGMEAEEVLKSFEDGETDGPEAGGGWVLFAEEGIETRETGDDFSTELKPGIRLTQEGEPLSNSLEGFLNLGRSDTGTVSDELSASVFADVTTSVSESEDNEEVEVVAGVGAEVGILAVLQTENFPDLPGIIFAGASLRSDGVSNRFRSNEEVSAEAMLSLRWQIRHGRG